MKTLYLAEGCGCIKIGITGNLQQRMARLRYGIYGPFQLVATWEHHRVDRVEMSCRRLLADKLLAGAEYFSASVADGLRVIEAALHHYSIGEFPRAAADKEAEWAAYRASVKIVCDSFNELVERGGDVNKVDPTFPAPLPLPGPDKFGREPGQIGQPTKLTADVRATIERRVMAGARVAEIASDLGLAEATVRKVYTRPVLDELRAKGSKDN